ncbi:PREDICTED: U-box domain-containing protein 5 [Ipomoea nil]|uniref:U-box domain-containing protein 5 n=1 Tax=Ipomoea nil TaxID=35883 RepID=UPI0009014E06|nr:PREDICTED: U-box domain-containing protein 5 [Ipomoea nil]XP_019182568.1 PREDICTED: U-box domain-containing protein 5 [Ipomoea nil]
MGSDPTEGAEALPSPQSIKVHLLMCSELIKFVTRALEILPEIEASRPRCTSGLEALCLLNQAIDKAKLILQQCSESSKIYLALTGDVILARCKKSTKLLERSLGEMQHMVPVMLAAEISQLVADLRGAKFRLDPSEEEAGKTVKELLHHYASASCLAGESAPEAIQVAMLMLNISTPKALVIEKRSINKMLLDKVVEGNQSKKKILLFFLNLLNKYGNKILKEKSENSSVQLVDDPFPSAGSDGPSTEVESPVKRGAGESDSPPNEFRCPISSRLMYDPVVIASGETYERMWIQRWFDEGNSTCPKSGTRLTHFSLTPNNSMKDLISRWCVESGVAPSDPNMQAAVPHPWELSSVSIASLGSSMNDLRLPIDFSNLSLGSSDSSYPKITSHSNNANGNSRKSRISGSMNEMDMESLYSLESLSWESQCDLVEKVRSSLQHSNRAPKQTSSENYVQPLMRFLNGAHDLQDENAQILGCQLLLTFLKKCSSNAARFLDNDAYELLVLFLTTKASTEALAILEELSCHNFCQYKIAESGALNLILDMLNSENRDLLEPSIRILFNLSGNDNIRLLFVPSELIPRLIPFFNDACLARYSLAILKNLCNNQDARISVAETDGCIASVAKLLDSENLENQEHAVAVLLSLCSQRSQYCDLVMAEGVIPDLVSISLNGNSKGKAMASEMLRILRDECHSIGEPSQPDTNATRYTATANGGNDSTERRPSTKPTGILGKLFAAKRRR